MSKVIKKTICLVLCALYVLSMVACGNSNNQGADSTSSSAGTSTTASETSTAKVDPFGKYDPGITLKTVKVLDTATVFDTNDPRRKSITENIWATGYKERLGITFDYIWTVGNKEDYKTKWFTSIASGDLPDIANVNADIYKQLLDAGYVEDMSQYFDTYASDRYKEYNTLDNGLAKNYMTFDGKLLGLPIVGSQPSNVPMLYIRKDWLDKVGKTEADLKTVDDVIALAKAFKDAKLGGDEMYGICISKIIETGYNSMQGFLNSFGAYYNIWMDDGAGKLVYSGIKTADQTKAALLKLQGMYKDGLIKKDFSVLDPGVAGEDIVAGKIGMAYGVDWAAALNIGANLNGDEKAQWIVITPPTADGSTYKGQASASPSGYVFVKKGIEHPEAAVKVMNLDIKLMEDENDVYGADFTVNPPIQFFMYKFSYNSGNGSLAAPWQTLNASNNIVDVLKGTKQESTLNSSDKAQYDNIKKGDRFTILYYGESGSNQLVRKLKENNQILVDLRQTLPSETLTTTGPTLKTALDAAIMNIIMGADIKTYDEAINAWKKGGGDKITEEVNKWYEGNKK